ncbi:unnamed protein product [Rhizophagus irregularis]|nr:unnamed protein product [Rhizophagus irregularis]
MTDTQSSLIFNNAAQDFATHAKANKFTAEEVLEGYGLYKQAIAGDIPSGKNNNFLIFYYFFFLDSFN